MSHRGPSEREVGVRAGEAQASGRSTGAHPRGNLSATRFQQALLRWYDANKRDLPWRHARDPYHIWLSEALLQQTRVETALPYYERFIAAFPTLADLAAAPLDRVLHLWQGLGYYTRARNLHRAAQTVVATPVNRSAQSRALTQSRARKTHRRGTPQGAGVLAGKEAVPADAREFADATIPCSSAELLKLPGVGPYTAAAVASIAFNEPVAAVDGNVKRVVARLAMIEHEIGTPAALEAINGTATKLLARNRPGDFNQAMMELGATICTPRNPRCGACPVARHCRACAANLQNDLPRRTPKKPVPIIHAVAAAIFRRDRLLLLQRPHTGLLGGLWEMPGGPLETNGPIETALSRAITHTTGLTLRACTRLGEVRHIFTHRDLQLHVSRATVSAERVRLNGHLAARWCARSDLKEIAMATLDQKAIGLAFRATKLSTLKK